MRAIRANYLEVREGLKVSNEDKKQALISSSGNDLKKKLYDYTKQYQLRIKSLAPISRGTFIPPHNSR